MSPPFTKSLAPHIQRISDIPAKEGKDPEIVKRGHLYSARAVFHMEIMSRGSDKAIKLTATPLKILDKIHCFLVSLRVLLWLREINFQKGFMMKALQLKCDVLVLTCIDYRFPHLVCDYLDDRGLIGNYDIFTLPGASLGACCEEYPHWNETLEEVITLALGLHSIKKIIVINHEECGAFQKLRGVPEKKSDEILMHQAQAKITHQWMRDHFPQLDFEFIYMNLCGKAESVL